MEFFEALESWVSKIGVGNLIAGLGGLTVCCLYLAQILRSCQGTKGSAVGQQNRGPTSVDPWNSCGEPALRTLVRELADRPVGEIHTAVLRRFQEHDGGDYYDVGEVESILLDELEQIAGNDRA